MNHNSTKLDLTDDDASAIHTYISIADVHGALLSVREAMTVVSAPLSEEELADAWVRRDSLSLNYVIYSGYIVPKEEILKVGPDRMSEKVSSLENRADTNMKIARRISRTFGGRGLRLFSVSGGNSYHFARAGDDIDFFCVADAEGLWLFMLRTLLLTRIYAILGWSLPRLCFNYALDERTALQEFGSPKDRLFARDALNAKVLLGSEFYLSLLREASWMRRLFPKLYELKTCGPETGRLSRPQRPPFRRVVNSILYVLVGSYIRLKSRIDNARYAKRGDWSLINNLRVGEGEVRYEARKYSRLRELYLQETTAPGTFGQIGPEGTRR